METGKCNEDYVHLLVTNEMLGNICEQLNESLFTAYEEAFEYEYVIENFRRIAMQITLV